MILALIAACAFAQEGENVGKRPYELDWAGRMEDDNPPLVDFEDMTGWRVETENAEATFERTREEQIWGDYVAKLTYRATGNSPTVRMLPPEPITIAGGFDAVTMWIYGNNWAWVSDTTTPRVNVFVDFEDNAGNPIRVHLITVRWREWFLCHRRLTPEQIERVKAGAKFTGFTITGGLNKADRFIYLDNLAVFTEKFEPLNFAPRAKRGIDLFPGQDPGANTGPGKLPFPTRPQTILPSNVTDQFTTSVRQDGEAFVFEYAGDDGRLIYRLRPETGTWSDVTAQWNGGAVIQPCVEGGARLDAGGKTVLPATREHLESRLDGDKVVSRWRYAEGGVSAEVEYTWRLWNKSLVIDTVARGGNVAEVRYGYAQGLDNARLVTNPFYTCDAGRPAVVVSGTADEPLFVTGNTDWYLSNASTPFSENSLKDGKVVYNGGTRYIPKTNGERNDCYERFFLTVSPRYEEMLPTVDNPVSPWKHVTGTRVWRAHGAGNRESDKAYWRRVHRYGMTQVVVTDHETMWRDGGESFTFRTKAAPGKGGDQGAYDYARVMQDELGFVYGPYNNFTDFAPVNEYWSTDIVGRTPDNQLQHAWARCYAPKPARAVEYCELLSPINERKYEFSTAYCDVHTAVTPWSRTDYDYRVPGAGTFGAVFYSYGEIMLLQKAAWDGPVYSEGNNHFLYCGLTDGNYGQDQRYTQTTKPWLVDFDLRKLHDLCCNFGMGNPEMFYGRDDSPGITKEERDAWVDRFLAATVAFGHPGFLTFEGGYQNALRSYYMLQQLHSRYCLASAEEIRYADADGSLLDTSRAVASGAFERSQIVTRYSDGTVTAVNGSRTERMKVTAYGRKLDLPPAGYVGWTSDGQIEVRSEDPRGHRCDYAVTPAYLYVDGRGEFMRFEKAGGNGIGICRALEGGKYELIPYENAECGFAVDGVRATALGYERNEIGPAEVRKSRGLTYVMPVEGAFSYIVETGAAGGGDLACERDEVVPGETVTVRGARAHELRIPADAKIGDRVWREFEGKWIDFTVVPLAESELALDGNTLNLRLRSNLPSARTVTATLGEVSRTVNLAPGEWETVSFDLGEPEGESAEIVLIRLSAGELAQTIEAGMTVGMGNVKVAEVPERWQVGMALRGQPETGEFGETRASVSWGTRTAGQENRAGHLMHPPYIGGVGYVFVEYEPVQLPAAPASAFRAYVCKGDGSDPGDGILYKLAVIDEAGMETVAARMVLIDHVWAPFEADLSRWAGQKVRLKLIADVGEGDDSSGDWAGWADPVLETLNPLLSRRLEGDIDLYRREPGPHPVAGLTVEDLRAAKRGWLRYDGMGLSGTGDQYGSFAVLNGVELGNMAPAGGQETQNIWAENVEVPLTPEAIATLGFRNKFELRNPGRDYFKVRRFWIELELADGRKCSSQISTAAFTQPPGWPYAEGIGVPHGQNITQDIWFPR